MVAIFKKVLVIGATSGIGESLASKFADEGAKVIVTGRRKERLEAFVRRYPEGSYAIQQDITNLESIPAFAQNIISLHPDLDCLLINSGIQRGLDLDHPESMDLDSVELELRTNYLSYVHLIKAFLPFFRSKSSGAMVFTSSNTALVPVIRCANYSASKAALHHFLMVLRQNMKDAGSSIKIIEIFPPSVQTELHDSKHQPDLKNGGQIGMPLKEFTNATYKGIINGDEDIVVGAAEDWYYPFEPLRQKKYSELVEKLRDYGK